MSTLATAGLVFGIVALAIAWFVLLWLAICFGIASVSGWRRLHVLYPSRPFDGPTLTFSGYVGISRYRGALIAGANPAGLYLHVTAPFRIGARPVFIPWRDIALNASGHAHDPLVTFEFPKARTRLRAPEQVAAELLERRQRAGCPGQGST